MRKVILSGFIIIILIIVMLSGCISIFDDEEKNQYYFEIRISMDSPFNYTLFAPIASEVGSTKFMEKIVSNLKIEQGTGEFELNWTEYGPALKIESGDSLNLVSEFSDGGDYHRLTLSMRNYTNETLDNNLEEHWIFCNGPALGELEVFISLKCQAGECCGEVLKENTLPEYQTISTQGWQVIIIDSKLR